MFLISFSICHMQHTHSNTLMLHLCCSSLLFFFFQLFPSFSRSLSHTPLLVMCYVYDKLRHVVIAAYETSCRQQNRLLFIKKKTVSAPRLMLQDVCWMFWSVIAFCSSMPMSIMSSFRNTWTCVEPCTVVYGVKVIQKKRKNNEPRIINETGRQKKTSERKKSEYVNKRSKGEKGTKRQLQWNWVFWCQTSKAELNAGECYLHLVNSSTESILNKRVKVIRVKLILKIIAVQ